MTGQNDETQWYIARDGKQHGPLSDVEMKTFVSHNYLRPTDLLWRPGMADWQPAPQVFPAVFQTPMPNAGQTAPAATQATQSPLAQPSPFTAPRPAYQPDPAQQTAPVSNQGVNPETPGNDFGDAGYALDKPRSGLLKQAVLALVMISVIGGGAFAIATFREPLMQLISGPPKRTADAKTETVAETQTAPAAEQAAAAPPTTTPAPANAESQTAALTPDPTTSIPTSPDPALIEGSALDERLQKIPAWGLLKKDFPDWYITNVAAADKLAAEKRPGTDVSTQLVEALVKLRRENANKALAAGPEKLKRVVTAYLENLRSLQALSPGACFGYIQKGELSPAIVELMQAPEAATSFNNHVLAIFEAVQEGGQSPVAHEQPGKEDYTMLTQELGRLGWSSDDLKTFSNPGKLARLEPGQVCKMVQEWFVAHLAVQDQAAQDRLIFETLKPIVSDKAS